MLSKVQTDLDLKEEKIVVIRQRGLLIQRKSSWRIQTAQDITDRTQLEVQLQASGRWNPSEVG